MRKLNVILLSSLVLLVIAVVAVTLYLRRNAPPEAVRLLPEADAIGYLNLKPVRLATHFEKKAPGHREPEYEDFVHRTGFQFERDLDEFGLAVHRSGEAAGETRYSEIFIGRFDANLLKDYLKSIAGEVVHYGNADIYQIPHEGRTVRVAILAKNMVAVSNTTSDSNIHSMIDGHNRAALPFRGPDLLRDYYQHVPFASVVWAIVNLGGSSPGDKGLPLPLPGGFNVTIPGGAVLVTSVRYFGEIRFKAEAFTEKDDQAARITDHINTLLAIYRHVSGPTDKDLQEVFNSINVDHQEKRIVLTATLPQGFLTKIISEAPMTPAAPIPAEASSPEPAQPKKPKK